MIDKFKLVAIGILRSAPAFVAVGYKWGEHEAAITFMELANNRNAIDVKTFTKMGVLLNNQEIDRLSTFISAMAHNSHSSMLSLSSELGTQADSEAKEYFNSNKSMLVPLSP
ncbi:MAG: hypothetical protein P1U52_01125 [Porticoccaceae bacterium]|nr:hypothetical protein [Porticoccaceae bacterium]